MSSNEIENRTGERADGGGALSELSVDECTQLLATHAVGRIAFLVDGAPMVLPVNYRFVERVGPQWLLIRTRSGSALDSAAAKAVAFEVDEIDPASHAGRSVVVRGTLHHLDESEVEPLREHFDPQPWAPDRNEWLVVKCIATTGRRLSGATGEWPFHAAGYL